MERVPPDRVIAILGGTVSAQDGKDLGRLIDVLVDDTGKPEAAVLDFGGFMGVGARKIAVHWGTLHFAPADPKQSITLDLTPDEIKAAPEYKGPASRPRWSCRRGHPSGGDRHGAATRSGGDRHGAARDGAPSRARRPQPDGNRCRLTARVRPAAHAASIC